MSAPEVLAMKEITKYFPGVIAVKNVFLTVSAGEIVGLVGENGAGKSTLMNVLGGVVTPDLGEILVDGHTVNIRNPSSAQQIGIGYIHQELELFPTMSVVENVFMSDISSRGALRLIGRRERIKQTRVLLDDLGLHIDPLIQVASLSYAERTIIEIAKAISREARILIFDEPTSSLTEREKNSLFRIIESLKEKGKAIIFISHNLEEVLQLSDRIVVLRDGEKVAELSRSEFQRDAIVLAMVGKEVPNLYPKVATTIGETVFEVENLTIEGKFSNVSFDVKKGEIFGIAGLLGSGKTDLARAIFGIERAEKGLIRVDHNALQIQSPIEAIAAGLSYVTNDRHGEGLVLTMSVGKNISLVILNRYANGILGTLEVNRENDFVSENITKLNIKTRGADQSVNSLSGGNQQKVVLAKWMATDSRVFILDEPTRGIDVGAKAEVHRIIGNLVSEGAAVILVSSEIDEIIGLADHVAVMFNGRVVALLDRADLSRESITKYAAVGSI